jgi:hypothetical protein
MDMELQDHRIVTRAMIWWHGATNRERSRLSAERVTPVVPDVNSWAVDRPKMII